MNQKVFHEATKTKTFFLHRNEVELLGIYEFWNSFCNGKMNSIENSLKLFNQILYFLKRGSKNKAVFLPWFSDEKKFLLPVRKRHFLKHLEKNKITKYLTFPTKHFLCEKSLKSWKNFNKKSQKKKLYLQEYLFVKILHIA